MFGSTPSMFTNADNKIQDIINGRQKYIFSHIFREFFFTSKQCIDKGFFFIIHSSKNFFLQTVNTLLRTCCK